MTISGRFCKYYVLETEKQEEVKGLERELKKRLLQEKYIRKMKDADVEDIAKAMDNEKNANLVIYDSEDFDVLYSKDWTIKKPRKIFSRKSGLYGLELVVKATPQDIIDLQKYLEISEIDVREARNVTNSIVSIASLPLPGNSAKNFSELIQGMAKRDFKNIKGEFLFVDEEVVCGMRSGYRSKGIYSGPVEDILRFRNSVIKIGRSNGTNIGGESVSFQ